VSDPEAILVRGPNWAGDLVMSTPGFRALRAHFPEAHIALQLRPGLEALMAGSPWFDEILPVDSYRKGGLALWREGKALKRSRHFDVGLCLPDSFSSALLMRVAGVGRVVGYRRGGRGPLLHQAVSPNPEWGRRRMVARERFVLGLTDALGCSEQGTQLELFTTAAEEARVDELLGSAAVGSIVAMAPGASFGPSKLWESEAFARVGDELVNSDFQVLLVGAPRERAIANAVSAKMRSPHRNLVGDVDLGSLKALLRRCRLLVCNDAGARHIAVAFGVPSIVIFGPTSLEKTNLNLEGVSALKADVPCRPCYQRNCPIDHRCMTRVDSDQVLAAARLALDPPPPSSDETSAQAQNP
jgi:heptosyltransferase-2